MKIGNETWSCYPNTYSTPEEAEEEASNKACVALHARKVDKANLKERKTKVTCEFFNNILEVRVNIVYLVFKNPIPLKIERIY